MVLFLHIPLHNPSGPVSFLYISTQLLYFCIFVFQFFKRQQYASVFFLDHGAGCHALDVGGVYTKHFVEYLYGQNAEDFGSINTGLSAR